MEITRKARATLVAALLTLVAVPALGDVAIRVATFNLEDVRTAELLDPSNERLRRLAEVIQRIRPNVILLNEIAYDEEGAPDVPEGATPGQNATRFVDNFLSHPQAPGLTPITYHAFMRRSNTGLPSGFDLDRSGDVVTDYPPPGTDAEAARKYGGDCWGYGEFPGQYAMALLVDDRLDILDKRARTFRLFPWVYMPGALRPMVPGTAVPWYDGDAGDRMRLSSKSHWDVPVEIPGGAVVHFLCAHPTPPAFDGPEGRNKRRNHDEIRFWADYLEDAEYLIDDDGRPGGLAKDARFVILGDMNADPDEGSSMYNPIARLLLDSPRVARVEAPTADVEVEGLDPDDTSHFRLRVDYVLPSTGIKVLRSGVWRTPPTLGADDDGQAKFPSDHYPVWADLVIPTPTAGGDSGD
ncbi:MAG: endonuclease/exonuclease/phosphatase family protein [Phycisphaerales bacterium]